MCEANGTGRLGWEENKHLALGRQHMDAVLRDLLIPDFSQHWLNYLKNSWKILFLVKIL